MLAPKSLTGAEHFIIGYYPRPKEDSVTTATAMGSTMSDINWTNGAIEPIEPQTYSTPATTDALVAGILRRCQSGSHRNGLRLAIINAPTKGEEAELRKRHVALLDRLQRKAKRNEIASAVTDMLMCFADRDRSDAKVVATFVRELQGFPLWSVQDACYDFRAGRVDRFSHTRAPSTVELRQVVEDHMRPVRAECQAISDVLHAEQLSRDISPQERQECLDIVDEITSRLRMAVAAQNAADRQQSDRPTAFRTAAELRAEFGEKFDAIPSRKSA